MVGAVALLAYCNSLSGPFIFDDLDSIAGNPGIRRLFPLSGVLAGTPRPFAAFTFALNYALGGLDVRGYHAVNLAVHALAALTLFAILRRTFASPRLPRRYAEAAGGLALAAAALWAAHPLGTQAVTYVVQRAESLAARSTCSRSTPRSAGGGRVTPAAGTRSPPLACALAAATAAGGERAAVGASRPLLSSPPSAPRRGAAARSTPRSPRAGGLIGLARRR